MSKQLQAAYHLFSAFKCLKHQDCVVVISHLNDQGVELISEVLHHLLQGHIPLHPQTKSRLRSKIQHHHQLLKKLTRPARSSADIEKKRGLLKSGGMLGALATISSALLPFFLSLFKK